MIRLSPAAWATLAEILNVEFIIEGNEISEDLLMNLFISIDQEFPLVD